MTENEEILNELKQISPYLVSISKENVLTVPANYFDVLPEQLLNYIATEKLIFDDKTQLFNVPSGYFEGFAETVIQKIKLQKNDEIYMELEQVAPLLNTINKNNVLTVPAHYFENFGVDVFKSKKQKAKVVSFTIAKKWLNYAAAAMMAGVLVTGAFLFTENKTSFDLSHEVNNVSDEELQNYIDNSSHTIVLSDETELNNKLPELDEHIQTIGDEELQQYLNDNVDLTKNNEEGS